MPPLSILAFALITNGFFCAPLRQPASTPPGPVVQPSAAYSNAEELLSALETADAELKTLTAGVQYDKVFELGGDRQIRTGKLFFEDKGLLPDGRRDRKFSVRFDRLQLGDRVEDQVKLMVFDGRWLIEVVPSLKQVIKREIVPAGEKFDPLKIGEGPLPLPIGQKKSDILSRFTATLLSDSADLEGEDEAETAKLKAFVKGSFQLKLTPRPNTPEARNFSEIRLWYRSGDAGNGSTRLLPRMARTVVPAGDVSVVKLINVDLKTPIDPAMMAAEEPGKDWNVSIEPLAPAGR